MNNKITGSFEKLERRKSQLFTRLRGLDQDVLGAKPTETSWSIIQILDHLHYAESASLAYAKKKMLAGDELKNASFFHTQRMAFYNLILWSKVKIKAPAVVSMPTNSKSFEEVTQAYDATRAELQAFLEGFPDEYLKKGVYKHPLAGRITIPQMVRFFDAHFIHHIHQIDRTLKLVS